jgi:putative acetyltransferase
MVKLRALAYDRSVDALVLLGAPSYYSRFGFVPGSTYGLRCKWTDGPAFQILELRSGALDAASGMVRYEPAFDALD